MIAGLRIISARGNGRLHMYGHLHQQRLASIFGRSRIVMNVVQVGHIYLALHCRIVFYWHVIDSAAGQVSNVLGSDFKCTDQTANNSSLLFVFHTSCYVW